MSLNCEKDSDKLRASELLGKSEGDFLDRLANEGAPVQMPVIILKSRDDVN